MAGERRPDRAGGLPRRRREWKPAVYGWAKTPDIHITGPIFQTRLAAQAWCGKQVAVGPQPPVTEAPQRSSAARGEVSL